MKKTLLNLIKNILYLLPVFLPIIVASFGIGLTILLLMGKLYTPQVLLLGTAISIASIYLFWRARNSFHLFSRNRNLVVDLLVLTGVVVWILFNMMYASQSVFVTRDPGIYTVAAKWLQNNPSTNVKTINLGLDVKTVRTESSGMWQDLVDKGRNVIQPQGMHLLSAYLGFFARLFGEKIIYKLNVVFGGIAILAIYAYSRTLLRAKYAWLPPLIIAAGLPMIYFSRDTYTEPLAMMFVFGGLTLLSAAMRNLRNTSLWILAGLVIGAATLARPDIYLVITAVTLGFILYFSIVKINTNDIPTIRKNLAFFYITLLIPSSLAILDIKTLTRVYYLGHGKGVLLQLISIFLAVALALLIYILWRPLKLRKTVTFLQTHASKIALLTLAVIAVLMARPLIYKDYAHGRADSGIGAAVQIQKELGEPLEERLYTEITYQWLSWYLGEIVVVLGFIGLAICLYRALRGGQIQHLAIIFAVLLTGILYLIAPNITPDQIWAVRRFLPVVLPGIAIFAIYVLQLIDEEIFEKKSNNKLFYYLVCMLVVAYIVTQPLLVSRPFIRNNEKPTHASTIHKLCDVLPKNSLVIWLGNTYELDSVQTTRAYCGVSSVGYNFENDDSFKRANTPDTIKLAKIASAATDKGLVPILAIHGSQKPLFNNMFTKQFTFVDSYATFQVQRTLLFPPKHVKPTIDSIELAELDMQGKADLYQAQREVKNAQ